MKIMYIRQYNFEIKPNKKNMDLGCLMHKHAILNLGPLCK